jgi:hypothetical protein
MTYDGQMSIYLVPRVFCQGGAAYGDKVQLISYLDRNYAGVETWTYLTHEGTHALAQDLSQAHENGGGPSLLLSEGLAVWTSGGHYRLEPIDARAAVTAASDDFVPLADLRAGPFYDFQHEIAYMEAASFVKYLVDQYGLNTLKEFYSQATGDEARDDALADLLYGKRLAELEADWLDYLDSLHPTPEQALMWQLEVRSFDLMRRYESELDPDAGTLPSDPPPEWLSDTLGIFLERNERPVNLALETALIAAQYRLHSGDADGAAALLDAVEAALDNGGDLSHPALEGRQAILNLLAEQDRAILLADTRRYLKTLEQASPLRDTAEDRLITPFTSYQQEIVRLDLTGDGLRAQGVALVHAQAADEQVLENGQLFSLSFIKVMDQWSLSHRVPLTPTLVLPRVIGD